MLVRAASSAACRAAARAAAAPSSRALFAAAPLRLPVRFMSAAPGGGAGAGAGAASSSSSSSSSSSAAAGGAAEATARPRAVGQVSVTKRKKRVWTTAALGSVLGFLGYLAYSACRGWPSARPPRNEAETACDGHASAQPR
jgi:hypothetical protein